MINENLSEELRLHQAASLLHDAARKIRAARKLLEVSRYASSPFAQAGFDGPISLVEGAAPTLLSGAGRHQSASPAPELHHPPVEVEQIGQDAHVVLPRDLVTLVNSRLMFVGPGCARVLLRMIAEPDQMVTVTALAHAAGIKSDSTTVIKVYICRLRRALMARGIPAAAINTGHYSYGLRAALFPSLADFLAGEGGTL